MTRCEGQYINYMRGTFAGYSGQCKATAKVVRNGRHYCLLHDPERMAERQKKRDETAWEKDKQSLKTFSFRVNDLQIYEISAYSEQEAKAKLIDRILELKIECLGEKKP